MSYQFHRRIIRSEKFTRGNRSECRKFTEHRSAGRESKSAHITGNNDLNQLEGFGSVSELRFSYVSGNVAFDILKLREGPLHRSGSASNPKADQKY
jgi:hypothetical protein